MNILKSNKYELSVLLLVAAGLRFYNLGEESLWNDELSTWKRANQESITEVIRLAAETDIHPPGYQIFMYGWISIFGDSEFSLRLPSALAGILSVWLIFILAKKEYGSIAGLTAAWMMAISWYPIYYSQEARAYSLMMMLVLGILYLMEKISKASWVAKTIFILSLIVLAYLHYFGSYFVGLLLLLQLVHSENRKFWLTISAILLISAIPWIPSAILQTSGGSVYIEGLHFTDLLRWMRQVFSGSNLFTILIIGLLVTGLTKPQNRFGIIRPLSWILLIWIPTWLISSFWIPVLTFPNMIIGLPFLLLVVVGSLQSVDPSGKLSIYIAVLYTLIAFNFLIIEKDYYGTPQKQQFSESVEFVVKENQGEALPVYGFVWDVDYLHYYTKDEIGLSIEMLPSFDEVKMNPTFWLLEVHRFLPDSLNSQLTTEYQVDLDSLFMGARVRKFILK